MSATSEILADAPTRLYDLNESSGTVAADSGSANVAGTYGAGSGSITYSATGLTTDADTAVTFAGNAGIALAGNSDLDFGTGDFTLEFWFKGTPSSTAVFVGNFGTNSWWLGSVSGVLTFNRGANLCSGAIVNDNLTHHIVLTRSGNTFQLYVDGVASFAAGSYSGSVGNTTGSGIAGEGGAGSSFPAPGTYDKFAIYKGVALSPARIVAHYNASVAALSSPWAFIGGAINEALGNSVTTSAINTTGANLVVVSVKHDHTNTPTVAVSDSKGNTWTPLTIQAGGAFRERLYYCPSPTVGSGHTFTASAGVAINATVSVLAFSGADASPFGGESGSGGSGTTSRQPGSVTPSIDNCLVATGAAMGGGTAISVNGGYRRYSHPFTNTTAAGVAFITQSTAAATNPTWSWTTSADSAAAIAWFKPVVDVTAPVLTSPTGTATSHAAATIGATTDEGNGTLYGVVTTGSTPPTATQVKAGQNSSGSAATFAGSTSVVSTGAKTISATGLTASTAYYAHLMHEDAAGNKSNVVTSAQFTTNAAPVTIAVNNANLFFSPYNWRVSGSSYAIANTPGAYIKTRFTGTSAKLNVDVSALSGASVTAGNYPAVAYSVDGGAFSRTQLTSSTTQVTLATGLSAGTHTLEVHFVAVFWNSNDRWTTPIMALKVTGLELDGGADVATPTLLPNRLLAFGDSHGEGTEVLGSGVAVNTQDARLAYGALLAAIHSAEYGIVAFGGQGYAAGGGGNVPTCENAWALYSNGASRLSGGLLSPAPTLVVIAHGDNDTAGAGLVTSVGNTVAAIRAAAPLARILVCLPPNRDAEGKQSDITSGELAGGDGNTFLIDPGENLLATPAYTSGAHLSAAGHVRYASLIYEASPRRSNASATLIGVG